MSKINGIYAASMSVINDDLTLDVKKTIQHAETIIDQGCHGAAIFGSTGQAQLISISEKIDLFNHLSESKYKEKYIIGTGLNSLSETINLMSVARSLNFKKFLIMPPAFYKYSDRDVINFYTKIIDAHPECEIVLYNFEKLSGYKFNVECVKELVRLFPKQIIGVKDSSYNLFENLKIENFSVLPGSESKLLKGLELGCSGIITATCNVTSALARKVYNDFVDKREQTVNQKLCDVRSVFEKYNLISGLHAFYSKNDLIYKNILPPLSILDSNEEKELIDNLEKLNFSTKSTMAA
ncbi:dihydrodipicolinate synthase family protein [uncultured Candidatus Pelagibacter sp.]|uniref:dihydrodipicolinate synthase family protein n=1 Tax=uncultured Candidatus Pelagibacter sp. TaxID=372654 RepID=UPI002337E6F3|nr:dihydrodipicolinate synthase family protein [uncultured Candidatus Pelagibacter sp.]MDB3969683.1 dihydrodipicolinate synthase family protein [Candidatus Pelagibacter sp.]